MQSQLPAFLRRALDRARRSPELARARRNTLVGAAAISAQLPLLLALAAPWLVYNATSAPAIMLAVTIPLVVPAVASPVLTVVQRRRFKALLDVDIPLGGPWRRQVLYHVLTGPAAAFGAALAFVLGMIGLVAATVYIWIWALPVTWRVEHYGYSTQAAYVTAGGLALIALATWLLGTLVRLDTRAATMFLGPDPATALERRVESLLDSRAGAVEAADAERRRIERDLHDGAQQRLVSMAVNLGLAKATLKDLPEDARKVIDEAHREAKDAIEELSSLVRGLHPAVLDERGLDAALSGVAARATVPVRLHVYMPERAAPTVEAVAYFVVCESLANIAKHTQATKAEVTVVRTGDTLRVTVSDDGVGGADPGRGSGLTGLAGRVGSVDGTFEVSSPAGGPTVIAVELPCVL
ncbi:sensor histidine kinase [Streptomyces sp. XD-27]|uniref:sensor histidine kinase n=1 Tax=Streptomyces sp. XD-27 TaxID=3062779 RepID=UPI0026F476BC|nr:sensor histidine kinase [Streptomyces sp. XD-27]WKX70230.1 sensor histidine kinase [Streptomyces sp. XD-27]